MEIRTCFRTSNFKECRSFYEDILRWRVVKEWDRGDEHRGVVYSIGTTLLELLSCKENESTKFDSSLYLYVEHNALESLRETLTEAGCFPSKIANYEWGHRSFTVNDPAGFSLKFFSRNSQEL